LDLDRRIGVIGIGKMGKALIAGLIRSKFIDRVKIRASDISVERREYVYEKHQITCTRIMGDLLRTVI